MEWGSVTYRFPEGLWDMLFNKSPLPILKNELESTGMFLLLQICQGIIS